MPEQISVATILLLLIAACGGDAAPATTSNPATTTSITQAATTTTAAHTSSSTPSTSTSVAVEAADVVFLGGDIVTMDPDLGTVEAIAIKGDLILAVGTAAEVEAHIGSATTVIDLGGRVVAPGFVDAHTHILTDMGGIAAGQVLALENGITSLGDASIEPGLPEEFIAASASGELRVRTTLYLTRTDPCGDEFGTWYEALAPDSVLGDRVRVGGVKIFADGGVCGLLASSEVFLVGYEVGAPYHDLEVLTGWIRDADAAGYQVIIHAQGDLAIAQAQDAYAEVLAGGPNTRRHRIEHNAIVTEAVVTRYGELGIVPTLFGMSSACIPDIGWTDFYKEYGDRPIDIVQANPGLIVAWHGDDPSLPPVSPIIELFSLVTRANIAEDGSVCEPPAWMADGGVTVEQGLAMMTINSAYALHQDHLVGSLVPGKLADLIVLTDNLLTIPADRLPSVEVLATIIGGSVEYCAAGAEAICPG
ncbi:MAG: amidohydrolase family protein [Acidimicrobiia bacterium]|nr:MAG: amidohydrolase family protein [Acidimicrobiia bacterium]